MKRFTNFGKGVNFFEKVADIYFKLGKTFLFYYTWRCYYGYGKY